MNLTEAISSYPEIKKLYDLIEKQSIRLTVLPKTSEFLGTSFQKIQMSSLSGEFKIPVDDELQDTDLGNPALILQLVIYAIEEYEDCDDFLVWSTAYSLDPENPIYLDWHKQLGEVTPKIRKMIGPDITGISDFDWQLNAGAAQALRELNL